MYLAFHLLPVQRRLLPADIKWEQPMPALSHELPGLLDVVLVARVQTVHQWVLPGLKQPVLAVPSARDPAVHSGRTAVVPGQLLP